MDSNVPQDDYASEQYASETLARELCAAAPPSSTGTNTPSTATASGHGAASPSTSAAPALTCAYTTSNLQLSTPGRVEEAAHSCGPSLAESTGRSEAAPCSAAATPSTSSSSAAYVVPSLAQFADFSSSSTEALAQQLLGTSEPLASVRVRQPMSSRELALDMSMSASVADLHARIMSCTRKSIRSFRLVCRGRLLPLDATLLECGIADGSVVDLVPDISAGHALRNPLFTEATTENTTRAPIIVRHLQAGQFTGHFLVVFVDATGKRRALVMDRDTAVKCIPAPDLAAAAPFPDPSDAAVASANARPGQSLSSSALSAEARQGDTTQYRSVSEPNWALFQQQHPSQQQRRSEHENQVFDVQQALCRPKPSVRRLCEQDKEDVDGHFSFHSSDDDSDLEDSDEFDDMDDSDDEFDSDFDDDDEYDDSHFGDDGCDDDDDEGADEDTDGFVRRWRLGSASPRYPSCNCAVFRTGSDQASVDDEGFAVRQPSEASSASRPAFKRQATGPRLKASHSVSAAKEKLALKDKLASLRQAMAESRQRRWQSLRAANAKAKA